jgi:hypothetical protein
VNLASSYPYIFTSSWLISCQIIRPSMLNYSSTLGLLPNVVIRWSPHILLALEVHPLRILFAKYEEKDATIDELTSCHLTAFMALLLTVSDQNILPSMEGDGDRAITSMILLFAHAVLPVNVSTDHGAHCGQGNKLLINAFALFTIEKGNFMMDRIKGTAASESLSSSSTLCSERVTESAGSSSRVSCSSVQ